jgi:hypothetical protein
VRLRAGGRSVQWSLDGWIDRFAEEMEAALHDLARNAPAEEAAE